jgi:hypothetical protein
LKKQPAWNWPLEIKNWNFNSSWKTYQNPELTLTEAKN